MKRIAVALSVLMAIMPGIAWASLYVVVSDNLKGKSFSSGEVKRIFLGEVTMVNNQRLILIYPSYSSSEIQTLSNFVGKGGSVRNLKSYWSKMIFTGKGNPPLTANNDGELKQMLGQGNAVGVATSNAGMNVVYTIG
jgi:hypothetical protein